MAGRVGSVGAFGENPAISRMALAQRKKIGRYVLVTPGEALVRGRELVHERKAHVMLSAREVYARKYAAEMVFGFPADLFAQTGLIADCLDRLQFPEELEKDRFQKIP